MLRVFLIVIPEKCFLPSAPGGPGFQRGALGGRVSPRERLFRGGLTGVVTAVRGGVCTPALWVQAGLV